MLIFEFIQNMNSLNAAGILYDILIAAWIIKALSEHTHE